MQVPTHSSQFRELKHWTINRNYFAYLLMLCMFVYSKWMEICIEQFSFTSTNIFVRRIKVINMETKELTFGLSVQSIFGCLGCLQSLGKGTFCFGYLRFTMRLCAAVRNQRQRQNTSQTKQIEMAAFWCSKIVLIVESWLLIYIVIMLKGVWVRF